MMDLRIKTDLTSEVLKVDDVSAFIKFEDSDHGEEVALIANMISSVRCHFEKRTGLAFAQKTFEVLFKYNDKPFVLPVVPIISIDKVELVDYQGTKIELILNSGYYKRGLYEVEIQTSQMTSGFYDLLVTFKAGYGHTDTENLPYDLKEAMLKQVKQWYDNRDDFYEFKILGSIDRLLNLHKIKLI